MSMTNIPPEELPILEALIKCVDELTAVSATNLLP